LRIMESSRKNIVLLVLDALRQDHVGKLDQDGNSLTPNLDKLSESGVFFENAFAAAPFTPASVPAFLCGAYPNAYEQYAPLPAGAKNMLISKQLKQSGYQTYCLSTNPYVSEYFGYNQGWDKFEELGSGAYRWLDIFANLPVIGRLANKLLPLLGKTYYWLQGKLFFTGLFFVYPTAEQVNKRINRLIPKPGTGQPFFLYAHFMDNHTPFFDLLGTTGLAIQRQIELNQKLLDHAKNIDGLPESDKQDICKLYEAQVKYMDKCLGDLFSRLRQHPAYQDTVFILTSDHGEELFEQGFHNHRGRLVDNLLRVPLLIIDHRQRSQTVASNVSHLHLPYTMGKLAGIRVPAAEKIDLLDKDQTAHNRRITYEVMRRRDNWMPFVGAYDPDRHEKLYGLRLGKAFLHQGPGRQTETNLKDKDLEKQLTALLNEHIQKSGRQAASIKNLTQNKKA